MSYLLPLPLRSQLVDYYVELLQIVPKVGSGGLLSNLSRITTVEMFNLVYKQWSSLIFTRLSRSHTQTILLLTVILFVLASTSNNFSMTFWYASSSLVLVLSHFIHPPSLTRINLCNLPIINLMTVDLGNASLATSILIDLVHPDQCTSTHITMAILKTTASYS